MEGKRWGEGRRMRMTSRIELSATSQQCERT